MTLRIIRNLSIMALSSLVFSITLSAMTLGKMTRILMK
jgi:hypothetical protein